LGTNDYPSDVAGDFDKDAETDAAVDINDDKNLTSVEGGTSLTCSLAADTPATGLVLEGSARVPFTYIDCTASADGDITIDSMTIQRTGAVAQDGAFSSIAVLDRDGNQQIGLNKTLNASHQSTLNDDVVVPSGSTTRLELAGNMAASLDLYAGEIPTLSLVAMNLKGGATLGAALPITGNYQNLNATVTIASGTLGTGPSNPTTDSAPEIGKTDVEFTQIRITNSSSTSVNPSGLKLRQLKWTQNGSASDTDIEDLDLVDQTGGILGTTNQDDKKAWYDFAVGSEPSVGPGQNRSYMIRGDTLNGTNRTIDMHIKNFTDVLMWDPDHSVFVTLTAGTGANATSPVINGTAHTIGAGSLKIEPAAISSTNIGEGSTQQVLGAFKLTAKGEIVEITSIGWHVLLTKATDGSGSSTTDITNVTIYDPNGDIVAGPQDFSTTERVTGTAVEASATTTDTISVPVGENVYTIKGDLSTDLNTDDTVQMRLDPATITATGEISGDTITPTPATRQTSVTNTIKTGTLVVSLAPDPVAASVVAGTQGHVFAHIVLDASASSEDVRISQIVIRVDATTAETNQLSNIKLFDGDDELAITNDADSGLAANATAASSTHSLSDAIILTKGTSKTLKAQANISKSTSANDIFQMGVGSPAVSATGADSGNTITPTYNQGDGTNQTVVANGTLSLTNSSASPKTGLLAGNATGQTVGIMNATTQYEDVRIEKMYVTAAQVNGGGWDQVDKLYLYDGGTLVTSVVPTSTDAANRTVLVDVTGDPLVSSKDTSEDYSWKVDTSDVNGYFAPSKGAAGQGFQLTINAAGDVTAKGAESSAAITLGSVPTFNSFYLFRSIPTVATNDDLGGDGISSGTIANGTSSSKDLYRFKVTADSSGDIALHTVSFLVTSSTATVTNMVLFDGTENVAATTTPTAVIDSGIDGSSVLLMKFWFTNDGLVPALSNIVPYTVSAGTSKSFTLRGDLNCSSLCSATNGSGTYQTQFLGDGTVAGTLPNTAIALNAAAQNYESSFVWSDLWMTLNTSSSTASNTLQWANGYLVPKAGGGTLQPTSSAVSFTK